MLRIATPRSLVRTVIYARVDTSLEFASARATVWFDTVSVSATIDSLSTMVSLARLSIVLTVSR